MIKNYYQGCYRLEHQINQNNISYTHIAHQVGRNVMTQQIFIYLNYFSVFFNIGTSYLLITPAVLNFISYGPPRSVKIKNQKQNIEAKVKGLCLYIV